MKLSLTDNEKNTINYIKTIINKDFYIVGGFVRDKILNKISYDIDITLDISLDELIKLFNSSTIYKKTFTSYFKYNGYCITIAALRIDGPYLDYRHPEFVKRTDKISEDYKRRDFTINCLYMDMDNNVLDPSGLSLLDINNRIIRMIGDPYIRLKEDPLRIVRAIRFKYELSFNYDKSLLEAMKDDSIFLNKLKKEKVIDEVNKCDTSIKENVIKELNDVFKFSIE